MVTEAAVDAFKDVSDVMLGEDVSLHQIEVTTSKHAEATLVHTTSVLLQHGARRFQPIVVRHQRDYFCHDDDVRRKRERAGCSDVRVEWSVRSSCCAFQREAVHLEGFAVVLSRKVCSHVFVTPQIKTPPTVVVATHNRKFVVVIGDVMTPHHGCVGVGEDAETTFELVV